MTIASINRTVFGLIPSTDYVIRVRSYDNLGVSSDWSEAFMLTTSEATGSGSNTFAMSKSYSITGTLAVASGATNYLPPFFVPVLTAQTTTLTAVRHVLRAGTANINIQQNGITIGSISPTTTATTTAFSASLSEDDEFAPVITSTTTADGLSLSFYFTITG